MAIVVILSAIGILLIELLGGYMFHD